MRHFLAILVGAGAGVTLAVTAAMPAEPATGASSSIIDRTFRCTPLALVGGGGLRDLDVVATPRGALEYVGGGPNPNPAPGYLGVGSGGFSPTSELVFVSAAAWERYNYSNRRIHGGVYANAGRCSPARVPVRLSPSGYPGPPVRWSDENSCLIRGRVLIRVRAVLDSAAPWQPIDRTYVGARKDVVEARLAVTTERGRRPIALLELAKSGQTRLWTSSTCS